MRKQIIVLLNKIAELARDTFEHAIFIQVAPRGLRYTYECRMAGEMVFVSGTGGCVEDALLSAARKIRQACADFGFEYPED